jgi:hypothetical protein
MCYRVKSGVLPYHLGSAKRLWCRFVALSSLLRPKLWFPHDIAIVTMKFKVDFTDFSTRFYEYPEILTASQKLSHRLTFIFYNNPDGVVENLS